jgi:RecB family exonuclease
MMPQSPSSLKLFTDCPWRYRGRYIENWYRFTGNEYTRRGTEIHGLMEEAARGREVRWPAREEQAREFGMRTLDALDLPGLRSLGWTVAPELEAAADGEGRPSDWNDRRTFVRSRIDLCMSSPDGKRIVIVDWKTGKTPADDLQLQMNALTLARFSDPGRSFTLLFVYLDQKKVVRGRCGAPDLRWPVDWSPESRELAARSTVRRVWEALIDCAEAHGTGNFEKRRGSACRWCEIKSRCVAGGTEVAG